MYSYHYPIFIEAVHRHISLCRGRTKNLTQYQYNYDQMELRFYKGYTVCIYKHPR